MLDFVLNLYIDVIDLILIKIFMVDIILPVLWMKKLKQIDIGETWIQSENQKLAFSTSILCCLLEMGSLGG